MKHFRSQLFYVFDILVQIFYTGVEETACDTVLLRLLLAFRQTWHLDPLHAPSTAADDGSLCVWVGETKFEDDRTATPTISICMIVNVNARMGNATVKTLRGPYGVWRDYIE